MQVARWGNSLAVRLPKALVDKMGLKVGDDLTILKASDSVLEVEKADAQRQAVVELDTFSFSLPADYRFNREEANAR
jgi:antitoxin MazE